MNCARVRELFSEYVEETLPAALRRSVRAHLDGCPACAADVAGMRAIWTGLSDMPAVPPPPFFHENVMAAVARAKSAPPPFWRTLLPQLSRTALGTLAAGGMAAAIAWTLLFPAAPRQATPRQGPIIAGPPDLRGERDITAPAAPPPRLRIVRTSIVHPEYGPAYEYRVRLEGSDRGAARFFLLPDNDLAAETAPAARFTLNGASATERLCVPFKAVHGDTMNLRIRWTADGKAHETYLFVPVPRSDAFPPERQSFGLPESSLRVAARETAERYGRTVALEDAPEVDGVAVIAREDTAAEALAKALAGRGLRLFEEAAGIRIAPDAAAPAR